MRAFLALPLPDPTLDALVVLQDRLPTGRPVPEDNLHMTLAFLGDVPDGVLEEMDDLLQATRLPAPEITFGGLGTFAEMQFGLVYVAVRPDPILMALQSKVAQLARSAGADLPRRRFRPHVTLSRSNRQPRGADCDRLAMALGHVVDVPGFRPDCMSLYQSELSSHGARHTALADYPLG